MKVAELPLEAEHGGGDQDLAGGVAGVVEGEPGLEIVAAVGDRVIAGDEVGDIVRIQPRGMRDQPDFRIDRGHRLGRAVDLRHADPVGRVDDLALQVGEIHRIVVHHADRAHPRRGEIEQERRAQTAGAAHQNAGLQQLLLADAADFGQDDVPRIALELLFGHRHRTGPGDPQPPVPVEPKPPVLRALSGSASTSSQAIRVTGAMTIWAMRMPRSTAKGAAPKLARTTLISPR